jgi:competence ComEA-like helix-hairpin-helix protein
MKGPKMPTFFNKKANYSNTQKYKSSSSKKYVNQKVYEKIDYGPKYTNENKLNLNMADTAQLQAIKGIGPVLSKRILKYRNSLGGFHSAEQLKDVYGLSPELVETMSDITFTTDSLTKIDINSDSLKYLASHPYIDYRMARSILNFRKVHGNYKAPEDLLKLKLMTDSLYKKLYPYISESQLDF